EARVVIGVYTSFFFFSSRRRHTRLVSDWSSDVCSSDLPATFHPSCAPAQPPPTFSSAGRATSRRRRRRRLVPLPPRQCRQLAARSEERRVGKECRARRASYQ